MPEVALMSRSMMESQFRLSVMYDHLLKRAIIVSHLTTSSCSFPFLPSLFRFLWPSVSFISPSSSQSGIFPSDVWCFAGGRRSTVESLPRFNIIWPASPSSCISRSSVLACAPHFDLTAEASGRTTFPWQFFYRIKADFLQNILLKVTHKLQLSANVGVSIEWFKASKP